MESSSSFGSASPASSVTPAQSVTPATASNAAPAPAPVAGTPAIESPAVLNTTNPTSRRFPMFGPGVGSAPVIDPNDPQVIAANASNDGTATHDLTKAYTVVTPPAPSTK